MNIISINKSNGWTSFDVVYFLKKRFKEKKIGHLGTLDPIATGVLPVFMGKATKLIPIFNNLDKTYRAVCKLGVATDTYDLEGKVTKRVNDIKINVSKITNALQSFLGEQKQLVPPFSATKINGIPFYKLARKGIKVPEKIRNVIFYELKIEKIKLPYIQYIVKCSKGTYIRAMANDLGDILNVGAHLISLERLSCGDFFNTQNSISIENLKNINEINKIPWISPIEILKNLNTINADKEIFSSIKFGRKVKLIKSNLDITPKSFKNENINHRETNGVNTKVLDINQNLIAIGYLLWENELCYFQPSKVFI